jgi:hypothetical protein
MCCRVCSGSAAVACSKTDAAMTLYRYLYPRPPPSSPPLAPQPCSDDYEGATAHNANLALKSIIAVGAFAKLCEHMHNTTLLTHNTSSSGSSNRRTTGSTATQYNCGPRYLQAARSMAHNWTRLAEGGREGAAVREYGVNGSWSQVIYL